LSGFESAGRRGNSFEGDTEGLTLPESKLPGRWIEPRFAALTLGIVALIVYGSLFPFEFYQRGGLGDAVRYLLSTPLLSADRGDVLSNVLLYVPLGLFGARAFENLSAGWRVLVMAIAGGALSAGIELAQFFDLSRASELSDVAANFSGALIGGLVETAVRARPRSVEWRPFAILLIIAQLGAWLYPYVPSMDPHAFRAAFGEALRASQPGAPFYAIGIYKQAVFWLAAAMLLEEIAGAARAKVAMPAMAALVTVAMIAIPGAGIPDGGVVGAVVGVLAWWLVLSKIKARAPIVAALFAGFVIVDALRPFTFLASPREFGWSPFVSFIDGPRGQASRVFLEKTFIYGSLLWLLARSGLRWLPATLSAALLVMTLRIAQMWLPGRSAEITDVLMVLILAAVMKVLAP
jgi:VanZ family protein